MTKFSDKEAQESLDEAPQWLRNALEARRVSPGFRERCREAAMVAHSMAVMRKTRASAGLVPDPLHRYVDELAESAGVKIEPVLRWLGVKSLAHPEPAEGRAYAKLGKALGMQMEDLIRHIVVSLGVAEGMVLALGKQKHGVMPINAVAVINQMETALSPEAIQKLHRIKAEIAKEYESAG